MGIIFGVGAICFIAITAIAFAKISAHQKDNLNIGGF